MGVQVELIDRIYASRLDAALRSDTSLLGATGSVHRFVKLPGRRTKKGATAAKRRYPDARA